MRKKERVAWIMAELDRLVPETPIPLSHQDPYSLLVAVLLSAQCTDQRVNQVTPDLFAKAPTPELMVQLEVHEIQEMIRTCGLSNSKASAIHRLSEILLEEHDGQVPASFEALERLPGVGHKTASVVMCQAFSVPAMPVDTHIHRLAKRWKLSSGRNVVQTERDLKRLFPRDRWARLHLQFIYYGRRFCPARGHRIEACPICFHLENH